MILISMSELGGGLLGLILLNRELVVRRAQNFLTAIFMMCYVPLFCLCPLLARLFVGGATSINKFQPGLITDVESYLVFQAANFGVLAMIWMAGRRDDDPPQQRPQSHPEWSAAGDYLTILLSAGVCLGIFATGLSVAELLVAGRFTWFHHKGYSPLLSVISSYLIALAPMLVYLCVMEKRWRLLAFAVALLILNGVLFKDRKWLIFIGSGLLAAYFARSGRRLPINAKAALLLALFGLLLWLWQGARHTLFLFAVNGEIGALAKAPEVLADTLVRGDVPYYYNASMTAIHMHLQDGYGIPFGLLRRQLFFFLPASFSFGLKIEDISAIFSDAIGGGDAIRRGNMPPGFFGLFILSFGWLGGVVAVALLPLVMKFLDRQARRGQGWGQAVIVCYALSSMVYLLRGDDSSATYYPIFALMTTLGASFMAKWMRSFLSRWG